MSSVKEALAFECCSQSRSVLPWPSGARMSRLLHSPFLLSVAGLALILALMSTAHAVAITNDSNSVNLVAPANDPGWNNVAQMSGRHGCVFGQ